MRNGFSLVELSIVLVILGILTGGILTGQSLIRSAELRSVITESQNYQTAVHSFKNKYLALPGDMSNAHMFWTSAGGSGVIGDGCEAATGTGTQTCSGNGDGLLDAASAADEYGEKYTFWQHLANAGLIAGNYTGKTGSAGTGDSTAGENVPQSKLTSTGVEVNSIGVPAPVGWYFDDNHGNIIVFGKKRVPTTHLDPVLTPEEIWGLDKKMDDGRPGTGTVGTFDQDAFTDDCTTTNDVATAEYDLAEDSTICTLIFKRAF